MYNETKRQANSYYFLIILGALPAVLTELSRGKCATNERVFVIRPTIFK